MGNPKPSHDNILRRVRKSCLALPDATETVTFGHPTFQVKGKTFAVLEEYKGELAICMKVGKIVRDVFLADSFLSDALQRETRLGFAEGVKLGSSCCFQCDHRYSTGFSSGA